jgi:hypothetical protein
MIKSSAGAPIQRIMIEMAVTVEPLAKFFATAAVHARVIISVSTRQLSRGRSNNYVLLELLDRSQLSINSRVLENTTYCIQYLLLMLCCAHHFIQVPSLL